MKWKEGRLRGLSLGEVVVVLAMAAAGSAVVIPGLVQAREESRAARCGANLAAIGQAYSLWEADNGGFMPPRCRAVSATCRYYRPCVGWGPDGKEECGPLPYAGSYEHALRIVGNAPVRMSAPDSPTLGNPAHYINADDRPLNRYVVPNWQCGAKFDVTRCPSDINSLKAPAMNPYPKGFSRNAIGPGFDIHGTSYGTNVVRAMPWRGHGPWATAVGVSTNLQVGPNFNPQRIFSLGRYVMMLDFASFYENWEEWLDMFDVGSRSGVGAWHEANPADTWEHGNALFGDRHAAFGTYYVPKAETTLPPLDPYIQAEWSLYPNRYTIFLAGS